MKNTEKSLIQQMRITDFEITNRKRLFAISQTDAEHLKQAKPYIENELNNIVETFYKLQTEVPDIALLIGDADTLSRLHNAQKAYISDLFSGFYDIEYVNNRLRIGMVHKRIGVEPKLYLAAILTLKQLLITHIRKSIPDEINPERIIEALEKLLMLDVSLVFDTYIRSLISEIEIAKDRSEQYASALEEKVRERTKQLEMLSRTDPLTGLLNRQHFDEILTQALRAAQRRNEPLTVAYVDINDFKLINDTQGHRQGDEILQRVANSLKISSRTDDFCFRYGGDEFCIIMPNCVRQEASDAWAKRLHETLAKQKDNPELSIGYAQTGPDKYITTEHLLQMADEEMYRVKKLAKNDSKKSNLSSRP
ncbi:MAG: GGDEF domain-containing protein [Candidatus Thiodiazotropha taylori]|nr:MAG: GGDEF domain-containing protein [gamma proteobacterium symbiont of Stewartia floridana]